MKKNIQACIISLAGDTIRRAHAESEIKKTDFSWQFIDAINGKNLATIPNYDAIKGRRLVGFELNRGEIGCFLSHRKAWQHCRDTKINTLILEDDFTLSSNFEASIGAALDNQNLWEILRLQALAKVDSKRLHSYNGIDFYRNLGDPLGSTAYIVKPGSAEALLKMSEVFIEPVDHFIENFRHHHIRVTAIKPYPIDTIVSESTIDDDEAKRSLRSPIRGWAKFKRSIFRNAYRLITGKYSP